MAAPTTTPNPPFGEAFTGIFEELSQDDRRAFQDNTAEGIVAEVQRLNAEHRADSPMRRFLERVAAIISPIRGFFDAIGTITKAFPVIPLGGVVWGALLFVVQMATGLPEFFNKIVTVLENIAERLPLYGEYAGRIYRDSERVQQSLANVYRDIILVASVVRDVFLRTGGRRRLALDIMFRALNPWSSNTKIKQVTQSLEGRQKILEEEMAHEDRRLNHADRIEHQFQQFLTSLPFEDCHHQYDNYLALLSPGSDETSSSWLLRRQEFIDWTKWTSGSPGGVLSIYGKPGVGKGAIASSIIRWIKNGRISSRTPVVAFFFFEPNSTTEPRVLLSSLLRQLLRRLSAVHCASLGLGNFSTDSLEGVSRLLNDTCACLARLSRPTFLIIDGLNECDCDTRKHLLPLLRRLGDTAKLLLLSRYREDLANTFQNAQAIEIMEDDIRDDIIRYISCKFKPTNHGDFSDKFVVVDNHSLREDIMKTLADRSEGTFLWLHPKIVQLQNQHTDTDIHNALESLPEDLELMYTKVLRLINNLPSPRRRRVRRTLQWVAHAKRPLTLAQLPEAVAIEEMEGIWDISRCVNEPRSLIEDTFDLVFCTGNPGPWRPQNAKVEILHTSLKSFLSRIPAHPSLDSSPATYYLPPYCTAQAAIVRECFKYLSLVAEQQGDNIEDRHPLLMYACDLWPEHLKDAERDAGEELVSTFSSLMQPNSLFRDFWWGHYNRNGNNDIDTTLSAGSLATYLALPYIANSINGPEVVVPQQ